jgi:hypothetical protein
MALAIPTVGSPGPVPPSKLKLGQWGMWSRFDLDMNSRGPLGVQDVVSSNPALVVGFTTFQLEVNMTGDHDVSVDLVLCDPFTGSALPNFAIAIGNFVSGVTEFVVTTFGDGLGFPMIVVGAWHTFILRFTVNDTLTTTKITADLRGAG